MTCGDLGPSTFIEPKLLIGSAGSYRVTTKASLLVVVTPVEHGVCIRCSVARCR